MAILGVGVDVCLLSRVEEVLRQHGQKFVARVLNEQEREGGVDSHKLARRWAMKEAVAKALGTGIGEAYGFHDIEISHTAAGAPLVKVAKLPADQRVHVSVSDDTGIAIAYAIWEQV